MAGGSCLTIAEFLRMPEHPSNHSAKFLATLQENSGRAKIRTWDLVVISDALCQLSYEPRAKKKTVNAA